jgi:hypothetical protein
MLDMAAAATADISMKCCGLCGQQRFVVGMTGYTVYRLRALRRDMASSAVVLQKAMSL